METPIKREKCQEHDIGLEHNQKQASAPVDPIVQTCAACGANLKKGLREDTDIGSCCSFCVEHNDYPGSPLDGRGVIGSPPDLMQPTSTYGRKTPEWMEHNFNGEPSPSNETAKQTGTPSEHLPGQENLRGSHQTYMFVAITNSAQLAKIIYDQLVWNELSTYSGVRLELGSHAVHGRKPDFRVIVRILGPSGGTATAVRKMLSSMNFGESLTSVISSDGLTVIHAEWREKVDHWFFQPEYFGLRQT